jgi:hypothetical protein
MNIGPLIKAPANASRLFETIDEALCQPIGEIQLSTSSEYEYIYNSAFDIEQIRYDLNYCTSNLFHFKESKDYFEKLLPKLGSFSSIVEIGCGQGEFVEYLNRSGFNAVGFDPVLKQPKKYLFNQLWTLSNEREIIPNIEALRTLYIMRCVLPHISEPFSFLDSIFEQHPNAGILIEFQRREWIEQNRVWPQISHDHVNIFSESDFRGRYTVLASGVFSNSEWVYVLFTRNQSNPLKSEPIETNGGFEKIFKVREAELSHLNELDRPIAIYGAAGKGIVFGYSLIDAGCHNVYAIDVDKNRQGLYMDSSGIRVLSLEEAMLNLPKSSIIVVMNPNHLVSVSEFYRNRIEVACIGRLIKLAN